MSRHYFITDVFAEGPYAGNQLATVVDSNGLTTEEMQQIARAFNFAETTFVMGGDPVAGFDVRIFTPMSELPFAGHPTLGTSYVIRNLLLDGQLEHITLNLGVGPIEVTFAADGVLWMKQNPPVFGDQLPADEVAGRLGLTASQIDSTFPCQLVSTGLEFLLVPLESYDALRQAAPMGNEVTNGHFLFCRGAYDEGQQIQARMFAGGLGVPEDPATGSANGCLAAYLSKHAYLGSEEVDARVGQGYEIARPSQLYLQSAPSGTEISVRVGGRVNLVAEGQWLL